MVAARSYHDTYVPAWQPPPRMSLSQWADEHYVLSSKTSADPGQWRTLPYQRGMMDAMADPFIERVSIMKSARIGYTEMGLALFAYHIKHDPCQIMIVQPTVEDAEGYSKEQLAEMLHTVPAVQGLVSDQSVKNSEQTILLKSFPGGVLSMVGANSARGFRRVLRRVVYFDEVDGYPASAGSEGDPIKLGENRAKTFWNRKIIAGSTPTTAGASRIAEMFEAGDRRRYYVPCPHCGRMDFLRFNVQRGGEGDDDGEDDERGHMMRWPKGQPELAHFMCRGCGCQIEEQHKSAMLEAGEWRADRPFRKHASFHIWAAYSTSPNTTWGDIAAEFVAAVREGVEKLKTVINTLFGETWKETGEAPNHELLYQRREQYPIGSVPAGVIVLTCGVDVQKDRLVPEVVGWGASKENWSIEIGEIHGDTSLLTGENSPWVKLGELLNRQFLGADGRVFTIAMMAVDSGYNTQVVYTWCRQHPMTRVIACKGIPGRHRPIVDAPSKVDVTINGRRLQRGYKVWPVGVDVAKGELYGWLQLQRGVGDPPPGWCHFPEHGEEYFLQLTAEHLVKVVNKKTRRTFMEWHVLPNRENHYLDGRILARAAAAVLGIDRLASAARPPPAAAPPTNTSPAPLPPTPLPAPAGDRSRSSFWSRPRGGAGPRGGSWLGRRR
jgi:phage terminase large subunit GpA-like protein